MELIRCDQSGPMITGTGCRSTCSLDTPSEQEDSSKANAYQACAASFAIMLCMNLIRLWIRRYPICDDPTAQLRSQLLLAQCWDVQRLGWKLQVGPSRLRDWAGLLHVFAESHMTDLRRRIWNREDSWNLFDVTNLVR